MKQFLLVRPRNSAELFLVCITLLISCGRVANDGSYSKNENAINPICTFSTSYEPSFAQSVDLNLQYPLSSEYLFDLIVKNDIIVEEISLERFKKYSSYPRYPSQFNKAEISRVLDLTLPQVFGETQVRGYTAYINKQNKVICIEPFFAFPEK